MQGQESGREELRQQIHNVTNYMKIIYILACQEKDSEIMEVTNQWSDTVKKLVSDNYCSLEYINIVLNGKKGEAHKENVRFHAYMRSRDFRWEASENWTPSVFLCNLLDNAIEAAPKDGRGYVNVTLFRIHEGKKAILKVENNFRQEPVERQGIFLTGKTDKNHHGFGTRYVRNKAEEYGGWSLFSVESGCFTAIVMIPLK